MDDIVAHLGQSGVFSFMTEAERVELVRIAVRKSYKKGDVICYQGDECRIVLYIAGGALRSVINAQDGREYIVSTWEKGEEFWSHTILDGGPMPSTLEAMKRVNVIYQWSGETVMEMVLRNRNCTLALISRQTRLIRERRENIYNLAFNPVASRLAKLILEEFKNTDNPTIQRDLTLEDMASMIATSPEVICRVMYQFQTDGLLRVDRASITLQDQATLEKLVLKD